MEAKLTINITVPGRVMYSQNTAESLEHTKENTGFNHFSLIVEDRNKKDRNTLQIRTRKCIPASRIINMSNDAYEWMRSKESCIPNIKKSSWDKLLPAERLRFHLDRICEYYEGSSYSYKIFDE